MKTSYRDRGQGGKMGHSNMAHWEGTEIIKKTAKKARRSHSKAQVREAKEIV